MLSQIHQSLQLPSPVDLKPLMLELLLPVDVSHGDTQCVDVIQRESIKWTAADHLADQIHVTLRTTSKLAK